MSEGIELLVLFVVLSAIALAVFLAAVLSTRKPPLEYEEYAKTGYAIRRRWFLGLFLGLIASFILMVPFFPYMSSSEALLPSQKVSVKAAQFYFMMPDQLPIDKRIVFEVTSLDVNHGFGIYDPKGHLIAQTQAMPDFTNYLPVTFKEPGQYKILCLEFCGVGHHVMEKDFTVGDAQ